MYLLPYHKAQIAAFFLSESTAQLSIIKYNQNIPDAPLSLCKAYNTIFANALVFDKFNLIQKILITKFILMQEDERRNVIHACVMDSGNQYEMLRAYQIIYELMD